jgi:hypothetical protein
LTSLKRELVKIAAQTISIFAKSKGSSYLVNTGPGIGRRDNREGLCLKKCYMAAYCANSFVGRWEPTFTSGANPEFFNGGGGPQAICNLLIGAIPLCCDNIVTLYHRLKHNIYKQLDNISKFWQHVSAVKSHHQTKIEQSVGTTKVCTLWDPIS